MLTADRWNQKRLGVLQYSWLPIFVVDAPVATRQRQRLSGRTCGGTTAIGCVV